jgi:hypothetical protein
MRRVDPWPPVTTTELDHRRRLAEAAKSRSAQVQRVAVTRAESPRTGPARHLGSVSRPPTPSCIATLSSMLLAAPV